LVYSKNYEAVHCEILGYDNSSAEDSSLLVCDTVLSPMTILDNLTLKTKATQPSTMWGTTHPMIHYYIPVDTHPQLFTT